VSCDRPKFEEIVWHSRQERLLPIDVVDKVAGRIRARTAPIANDWSLWGAVGLSVTAAVVLLLLAMQQGVLLDDPLANWLRPLVLVMK
jgi:hypothetical protein